MRTRELVAALRVSRCWNSVAMDELFCDARLLRFTPPLRPSELLPRAQQLALFEAHPAARRHCHAELVQALHCIAERIDEAYDEQQRHYDAIMEPHEHLRPFRHWDALRAQIGLAALADGKAVLRSGGEGVPPPADVLGDYELQHDGRELMDGRPYYKLAGPVEAYLHCEDGEYWHVRPGHPWSGRRSWCFTRSNALTAPSITTAWHVSSVGGMPWVDAPLVSVSVVRSET